MKKLVVSGDFSWKDQEFFLAFDVFLWKLLSKLFWIVFEEYK